MTERLFDANRATDAGWRTGPSSFAGGNAQSSFSSRWRFAARISSRPAIALISMFYSMDQQYTTSGPVASRRDTGRRHTTGPQRAFFRAPLYSYSCAIFRLFVRPDVDLPFCRFCSVHFLCACIWRGGHDVSVRRRTDNGIVWRPYWIAGVFRRGIPHDRPARVFHGCWLLPCLLSVGAA